MILEKCVKNLIQGIDYKILKGNLDENVFINKMSYDSRNVETGDLFICLNGAIFDSHSKINEVINSGARVIIVEKDNKHLKEIESDNNVIIIEVKNTRTALAVISKNYFCKACDKLKIIGITGTKGKTTTAFMIKSILETSGKKVGMIGTIGIFIGDEHIYTENTTPESYILHENFAKMLDQGIEYVVMEVSSQSLKYNRVYGMTFEYAVWTNIAPEHIGENEHDDYDDYLNSKLLILNQAKNAVINADTANYSEVIDSCKKNDLKVYEKKENLSFKLRIPGSYNQENASLAYVFGKALGIDDDTIRTALQNTIVPGRCELVFQNADMKIYVDFSYEDNGAKRFLETMRNEKPKRLVTVYGCGGNRSKNRRYGMGEVTGKLADFIVLTADNSRFEKTIDIIKDIETTLTKYKKINDLDNGYVIYEDRRDAIKFAIENRKVGDVICVMGKGHEPMMEMNGEKIRFLDREVILEIIDELHI